MTAVVLVCCIPSQESHAQASTTVLHVLRVLQVGLLAHLTCPQPALRKRCPIQQTECTEKQNIPTATDFANSQECMEN